MKKKKRNRDWYNFTFGGCTPVGQKENDRSQGTDIQIGFILLLQK